MVWGLLVSQSHELFVRVEVDIGVMLATCRVCAALLKNVHVSMRGPWTLVPSASSG